MNYKKYFISYVCFTKDNPNPVFGNAVIECPSPFTREFDNECLHQETLTKLQETEPTIKAVTILNIVPLPI